MIKLAKSSIPDILKKRAAKWTSELLDAISANSDSKKYKESKYRHPEIKGALIAETHGKCAYCESKIRHIAYGDIEHIIPKSIIPERAFDWINLTLGCDICNTNKGNYLGDLIDPYQTEPSIHLLIEGPLIIPAPGSEEGRVTERTLDLNRLDLVERRIEKIQSLMAQIQLFVNEQNQNFKDVLRRDIEQHETADSKEYAALARHLVSRMMQIAK